MLSAYFKVWFWSVVFAILIYGCCYGRDANAAMSTKDQVETNSSLVVTCFIPDEKTASLAKVEKVLPLWQKYLLQELANKKVSRVYLLKNSRAGVVFTMLDMPTDQATSSALRISAKLEEMAAENKLDLKGVCNFHPLEEDPLQRHPCLDAKRC